MTSWTSYGSALAMALGLAMAALGGCAPASAPAHDDVGAEPDSVASAADADAPEADAGAADAADASGPSDAAATDAVPVDAEPSPEGCAPPGWVLRPEVANARDLGGIPLAPGQRVACRRLVRGGPLSRVTPEVGCAELAALGVRTVVDLRMPQERQAAPPAPCVATLARLVEAPMPIPYDVSPTAYLADLHAENALRAAFDALGDPAAYPVYFHCTYGRDRTGVLAAVILRALGASRAEILADYRLTADAGLSITPQSLEAVLDELDRVGGVDAYLASIGIPAGALSALRAEASAAAP